MLVSFKIAPELFNKGIGKVVTAAKEAGVFARAGELVGEIGKKVIETVSDAVSDTKTPIAVTPEGSKVPIQLEGKGEPTIIAEMEGDAARVGGTKVPQPEVAQKVEPVRRDIEGTKQWVPEVEETAKHNNTFKAQVAEEAQKLQVDFLEDKLPHIFEDREGHLPDTPEHRSLLLEVASDPKNYFAMPDKHGNIWCEKFLDDGTQVWVSLRNNRIRNGGLNLVPIEWKAETGLASLTLPFK